MWFLSLNTDLSMRFESFFFRSAKKGHLPWADLIFSRRSASRTDIRIVQNQFAWRSVCSFEVSFHKNLSSPAWCCSKLIALLDLLPDHQPNTAPLFAESTRRCRTFLGNASCMLLIGFELACARYLFVTCMNRPLYWNQTSSVYMLTSKNVVFLTGQVCLIPCIWPKACGE